MNNTSNLENQLTTALKTAAKRLAKYQESIAIIGMSGVFPGANDTDQLWELLRDGKSGVSEIPPQRFDIDKYYSPKSNQLGKICTRRAGLIDKIDYFDAEFFGMSPKEAELLDPQHRLVLQETWHALEDAGIVPTDLAATNTGVFIGISTHDYEDMLIARGVARHPYASTGNALSAASGRISHYFGLQGPCMAIDTACSSSLVAVNEACQRILIGDCDLAIAGGVNALLLPKLFIIFSGAGMLSPAGECRTFDEGANGYVRGEGCGVVILKRLSAAQQDGDNILAVIKASGVNQDGRASGLTVPNGMSQTKLLQKVLQNSKLSANDIDYVECHGTATSLGDPIECHSIARVYGVERENKLGLGSIKANVGHLEAAAGIAGLIKSILMLQHNAIPGQITFKKLNPAISLNFPYEIYKSFQDSETVNINNIAISSFGFTGTNAHLVLSKAPQNESCSIKNLADKCLFVLSARSKQSLRSLIESYNNFLSTSNESLDNICYSLAVTRSHHNYRIAIIAKDKQDIIDNLRGLTDLEPVNLVNVAHSGQNILEMQDAYLSGETCGWLKYYESSIDKLEKVALPHYEFNLKAYWVESNYIDVEQSELAHVNRRSIYREIVIPHAFDGMPVTNIELDIPVSEAIIFTDKDTIVLNTINFDAKFLAKLQQIEWGKYSRLFVITENAYGDNINPHNHCYIGLFRSLTLEKMHLKATLIDVDDVSLRRHELANIIASDIHQESVWIVRNKLYTTRLIDANVTYSENKINQEFAKDKAFLISGGTGALGTQVCKWLISLGAKKVILISRKPMTKNVLDYYNSDEIKLVQHYACDMASTADIDKFKKSLPEKCNIDCIFHLAGVVHDNLLENISQEEFESVQKPKVIGLENIYQLGAKLNTSLLIAFSSAAAVFGNPGQLSYAMANAYMDGFAKKYNSDLYQVMSINLGPIAGGGMAQKIVSFTDENSPVQKLSVTEVIKAVQQIIYSGFSNNIIAKLNKTYISFESSSYLKQLSSDRTDIDWLSIKNKVSGAKFKQLVSKEIISIFCSISKVEIDTVSNETDIFDYGIDSIMLAAIKNQLNVTFRQLKPMQIQKIIECRTINNILNHYVGESAVDKMIDVLALDSNYINRLQSKYGKHAIEVISQVDNFIVVKCTYQEESAIFKQLFKSRITSFSKIGVQSGAEYDDFDNVYEHILLFETGSLELIAGCRVALLKELSSASKSFKLQLEYNISSDGIEFLKSCAEVSRLFTASSKHNPLVMINILLSGVINYLRTYDFIEYTVGTVSLPSDIHQEALKYIMAFCLSKYEVNTLSKMFSPIVAAGKQDLTKYKNFVLKNHIDNFDELESVVLAKNNINIKVPMLFRIYFENDSRLISFAIDTHLYNVVQALVYTNVKDKN